MTAKQIKDHLTAIQAQLEGIYEVLREHPLTEGDDPEEVEPHREIQEWISASSFLIKSAAKSTEFHFCHSERLS